jgi:glycosyltransferase involved in cell wall biosynthesis
MKFSLIVPVYRQEKTIRKEIHTILQILSRINDPFEVIIVIDGLIDGSMDEAKKVNDKRVNVVGYKTNHGKGYAIRYGMSFASGEIIGFTDSGGDLNIDYLPLMIEQFRFLNADIIIGSKRHPDSKVNYPFYRKILSWGYQMVIRLLFGLNVRDTQVGIKLYKRKVLEDVLPRLLVKRFAFDIEILSVANHLGYKRIYEAPIELNFNVSSSITTLGFWKVVFNMLWDTAAVFYRLRILRYYDN